jgi:biopolymer transport protein ExbD
MTALIDVVFILLLFFMLASSFLDWRSIRVAGRGGAGAARPGLEGALLVDVRIEGIRLSGMTVSPDELSRRVRELVAERPGQRVIVRPGAGVSVQRTVAVLDRLDAAGAGDVTLAGAP